jgi:acyl-CoA thioesterase I
MNKKLIMLSGIIILGFLLFWFDNRDNYKQQTPLTGTNVIVFGDSLVAGDGATEGNDLVSLLSKDLGLTIMNAGVGGDTTASALNRIDQDVLNQDPKVVVILLGGNDFLRRVPIDQTVSNLGIIIDKIKAKGAGVILVGFNPSFLLRQYSTKYEELANQKQVSYVPDVLANVINKKELMYDSIHPNDQGYKVVASRIEPKLKELLNLE